MTLQRIGTKLFLAEGCEVDAAAFVPVFQRWIQRKQLPGLLIDVADYSHAHHGPGIMLIGDEGDLSFDFGAGRPGLLYMRKRAHTSKLSDGLALCARLCLQAVDLLQREQDFPALSFSLDEIQVALVDRLRAPNTAEAYADLRSELALFAYRLFGDADLAQVSQDPRENLCVAVSALEEQSLAGLLARTAPVALR